MAQSKKKGSKWASGDYCCAIGCNHRRGTHSCNFLAFPIDKEVKGVNWRDKWIKAVKRCAINDQGKPMPHVRWKPKPHHKLCSCHFSNPPDPKSRRLFSKHVVPDRLPGHKITKSRTTVKSTNRAFVVNAKHLYTDTESDTDNSPDDSNTQEEEGSGPSVAADCSVHTENDNLEGEKISEIVMAVQHDHDYLCTVRGGRVVEQFEIMKKHVPEFSDYIEDYNVAHKNSLLLETMQGKGQLLTLNNVSVDKKLFQYYTGLPSYDVFLALYRYLKRKAENMQYVSQLNKDHHALRLRQKPGRQRSLSLEEEFFATLVRLRLGLPCKDLARRFGIADSTFSVIFNTWIILLSRELEQICVNPSANVTKSRQAECFNPFDNVRIVLDCTEVFSQTPSSLSTHKHFYSNYKHHSTVKFLVGISPNGAITYVSEMWGGRASDKKITSASEDLIQSLQPGDKVMVDRGFTIAEDLPDGVKLIIPPFKNRTTGQFTAGQLEFSEKVSQARIHVERAMRAIKESRILEAEVKLGMINNFENLFKVCAYLVNFKQPFLKV